MPGVLIVEAMAQISSLIVFGADEVESNKQAYFLGIDKAKFRKIVVPGDQLVIECKTMRLRRNAIRVRAVAKVDGIVVTEAEMLFGVQKPSSVPI